jgi:uncharacterized protein (DUF58 family)
MHPTRLGILLFVAGLVPAALAGGVDVSLWSFWLAFLVVSVALLAVDLLFAPPLRRLEISWRSGAQLAVGAEEPATLWVHNPGRLRLRVEAKLDLSPDVHPVPALATLLKPGNNPVSLSLHAQRRGQAVVEGVWIRARGPLGLLWFAHRRALNVTLPVVPNLPAVQRDTTRLLALHQTQAGLRVERHRGDGTEYDHLREYVTGLDIRSVDWKASARHGKMLCREYRAERNRPVMLVLDSGRLMAEPIGGVPRLDHAIHGALVLATVSLHLGDQVGLAAFDDRLRHFCPPQRGTGALAQLGSHMSGIGYSTQETNFTLGLTELMGRTTRRALVVVMTDFVDTITAELMIENLAWMARRHLILFVALQDPLPAQVANRRPRRLLDLHRAVVAHGLQHDRELVIRRLQRLGILCLDTRPEDLSASLVERYLEAKRREWF